MDQPPPLTLADLPEPERAKVQRIVDTTVRLGRENEALAAAAQQHDGIVARLQQKLQKTAGLLYLYQSALEARLAATDELLDSAAAEHVRKLAAERAVADALRTDNARVASDLAEALQAVAAQKRIADTSTGELKNAHCMLKAATERCSRTEEACLGLTKQLSAVALKMRSMQAAAAMSTTAATTTATASALASASATAVAVHKSSEERRRHSTRHAGTQCSAVDPACSPKRSDNSRSRWRPAMADIACSPMRFSITMTAPAAATLRSPGDKENRTSPPKRRIQKHPELSPQEVQHHKPFPTTCGDGRYAPTRAGDDDDRGNGGDCGGSDAPRQPVGTTATSPDNARRRPPRQHRQQEQGPQWEPVAVTRGAQRASLRVRADVPRALRTHPPTVLPPASTLPKRRAVTAFDGDYDMQLFSLLDNI